VVVTHRLLTSLRVLLLRLLLHRRHWCEWK
jgi:hypothetical protein